MRRYLRILVVGDSNSEAVKLHDYILTSGVGSVAFSSSYKDSLEILRSSLISKKKIHAVFLEIFDRASGEDFIAEVMDHEILSETKIILVLKKSQEVIWAFRLGAFGLLKCPIQMNELLAVLNYLASFSKRNL